jgi:hypothetical protein
LQALGREAAPVFRCDEGAQLLGIQRFDLQGVLATPCVERREIAPVTIERVRRHASLDLEMGEEVFDG